MYKTLEHHEHAEHVSHSGAGRGTGRALYSAQLAALLVATLAAGLAVSEQGAKHAEIRVQSNLVAAANAWAQYQAKSTRATVAKNIAQLADVLDSSPEMAARRSRLLDALQEDRERYEWDSVDGKEAIAQRAYAFEHARDHALEQTHAYHNGSAAMELGIVLATASAIIGSRLLIGMAVGLGLAGGAFALLGLLAPAWGAL